MADAAGFDQQTLWALGAQQAVDRHLQGQPLRTTHATAGDFPDRDTLLLVVFAVDADAAEFIHQHRPFLRGRFVLQQMQNSRGFADTEKTGQDVGWNVSQRNHGTSLQAVWCHAQPQKNRQAPVFLCGLRSVNYMLQPATLSFRPMA